jgi:hypothetical protein
MDRGLIKYIDTRIGIPYKINGRSPEDGIDCVGAVEMFYSEYLGVDLSLGVKKVPKGWHNQEEFQDYKQQLLRKNGSLIKEPELYCIVLVADDRGERVNHVGIFLGDDKVFNTGKHGTYLERLSKYRRENMLRGYLKLDR